MEFQKFGLNDEEDKKISPDYSRNITYNDGIFYLFDVYGDMQEISYKTQLDIIGEYNSNPDGSTYLSSDNI